MTARELEKRLEKLERVDGQICTVVVKDHAEADRAEAEHHRKVTTLNPFARPVVVVITDASATFDK